jgi:hypothetical protein
MRSLTGSPLASRSIWKSVINRPKTRASAQAVPVIRQLAEILNDVLAAMKQMETALDVVSKCSPTGYQVN